MQPYLNGGTPNNSWEMPSMKSAIYVSGPVDDPSVKGDLRNVMMCIRDAIINCNLL